MKQHLINLAQILMLDKCKELNIDCSGSCTIKHPRKQEYTLKKQDADKPILMIIFHKSGVPIYLRYNKQ